jgi:hypothetical protein
MTAIDIIDQLPFEFAARLETNPFFADIPVVVAEKGNVALEYQRKQAAITEKSGKRGICVVVLQLTADDLSNNLQFGPMILRPAFQVAENVELNHDDAGTGKSARKVSRKIRDVMKNCNLMGLVQDMKAGKPCIEPVDLKDMGDAVVGYQVNFECLEVSTDQQTQVQMPAFATQGNSPETAEFLLTSATAGAAIWFTTDDSFPYNGGVDTFPGSTAQLYTGPVSIPAGGVTIRACAYLDGAIASGINRATINYTA